MTIHELIERLDMETDSLDTHLKKLMKDDTSPVEAVDVDYELIEGGEEIYSDDGSEGEVWVIKSFVVWTQDFIYHTPPDEDAFLYESGTVFKVKRNPKEAQ